MPARNSFQSRARLMPSTNPTSFPGVCAIHWNDSTSRSENRIAGCSARGCPTPPGRAGCAGSRFPPGGRRGRRWFRGGARTRPSRRVCGRAPAVRDEGVPGRGRRRRTGRRRSPRPCPGCVRRRRRENPAATRPTPPGGGSLRHRARSAGDSDTRCREASSAGVCRCTGAHGPPPSGRRPPPSRCCPGPWGSGVVGEAAVDEAQQVGAVVGEGAGDGGAPGRVTRHQGTQLLGVVLQAAVEC